MEIVKYEDTISNSVVYAELYQQNCASYLILFTHAGQTHVIEIHHGVEINRTNLHDDVINWKHFLRNWPFVREIHRSPVNFPHNGQWRGALMFSLIHAWINDWVNNREAGDLRRQHGHYDVIVMYAVNTTTTDNLAHQSSSSSAGMALLYFPWHIPDLVYEHVMNTHIYTKIYRPPNNGCFDAYVIAPAGKQPLISSFVHGDVFNIDGPKGIFVES